MQPGSTVRGILVVSLALQVLSACSNSTDPGVDDFPPPPGWGPVESLDLEPGAAVGALRLSWIPPSEATERPPLARYEIAHSLQPIASDDFETLPRLVVDHDPDADRQTARYEDLELGIVHHFRIRTVDELDRTGELSEEISGTPAAFGELRFLPQEDLVSARVGDQLRFEVRSSANESYDVEFRILPDIIVHDEVLLYQVQQVGEFEVRVTVGSGGESRTHTWSVRAAAELPDHWGPVGSPRLEAGALVGELILSWSTPTEVAELPPLELYEIAHSRQPISPEDFDALPKLAVAHDPETERYSVPIDDLELGVLHHFRIRAVDELEKAGELSPELSGFPAAYGSLLFLPEADLVAARYGDELRFEVRSGEGESYDVEFRVLPDVLVHDEVLLYQVRQVGDFEVHATVRSGGEARTHSWTVRSSAEGLGTWGKVQHLGFNQVNSAGEVVLDWISPADLPTLPPLHHYELVHSQQPISPADFESLPKSQVPHIAGSDYYWHQVEGLASGIRYYFRVRAVDELGRVGALSDEIFGSPIDWTIMTGTVRALDSEFLAPSPLAGVRVAVLGAESYSDASGGFGVPTLLGLGPITVELNAASAVPPLYPIVQTLPDFVEAEQNYLLIPRRTVTVMIPDPTEWEFLHLLRVLSSQVRDDTELAHWEHYPVEIQVQEKSLENGVDYAAAVRTGIQKWNDAAGFTVLVETPSAPAVGVVTRYDLPLEAGGTLGEVRLVEPADGMLYRTVPRRLSFALVEWFVDQDLAERVALHELGHVLYLTHSPSNDHVLSPGVHSFSPNEVHPDEALVLRALVNTPNGTRYSWYQQ